MPYVNLKIVKQQVNSDKKELLLKGLMDIIVNKMGRDPKLTVITVDEIDKSNWYIGGQSINESKNEFVSFVEIKISKGTSNPEQMAEVIKSGKDLINNILGTSDKTNYFVINELNPDAWGFDGITMTDRRKLGI